ncbi:MAG: S-layer homology domain-containing protein [Cyanobacteria bacterium P01_G01_bin.54]
MTTFYVDPANGSDRSGGTHQLPFQTLTHSLRQAQNTPDAVIQLAPGNYNETTGEVFPLLIPAGVKVIGDEAGQGQGINLRGGGRYTPASFSPQNITVVLGDRAQLSGVTLSNPTDKGIAVWLESAAPLLRRNTIAHCGSAGIVVTGSSKPRIQDNRLFKTGSTAIFLRRQAKGEIQRNLCQQTNYGITISDDCAPLVSDNTLSHNQVGLYLSHQSLPVLRRNRISENKLTGLLLKDKARPDFGHAQIAAGNILIGNGRYDVQNESQVTVQSGGNQFNAQRIKGKLDIAKLEVASIPLGPAQFHDVGSHWAGPFIGALVMQRLLQGFPDGSFRPDARLTRAEYAALLAQSFNLPRRVGTIREFRDVPSSFWGYGAIVKAAQMGFLSGYGDGSFRPGQPLTRVQALLALVNGLGLAGGNPTLLQAYRDRAEIPSYATAAIATATEKRLVAGYPDPRDLRPMQPVTRGEVAVFLHQALVTVDRLGPIESSYLVDPEPHLPVFSDVTDHWAAPFLRRLASLSLVTGFSDGSFRPDAPINRAQYAALLMKALQPKPARPATMFLDVSPEFWGYGAISGAYQAGFLSGFPDGTFHPEQQLQRIHLIVSLVSGLELNVEDTNTLSRYTDASDIPAYAQDEVAGAIAAGLIASHPNPEWLNPKQQATRAEAAVMLYQVLVHQGKVGAIDSPYVG